MSTRFNLRLYAASVLSSLALLHSAAALARLSDRADNRLPEPEIEAIYLDESELAQYGVHADSPLDEHGWNGQVIEGKLPSNESASNDPSGAAGAGRAHCEQSGIASSYGKGDGFQGKRTASGERFNTYARTAAHPSLPMGTRILVTNKATGRSVVVRVNDRGPYAGGRIIDLSYAASSMIGIGNATGAVHLHCM